MSAKAINTTIWPLAETETRIQQRCIHWFRLQHTELWKDGVLFHISNEGIRSPRMGARFKKEGGVPGVADLCLALPRGGYGALYIEMKRPRTYQSQSQKLWQKGMEKHGNRYAVCRSLEEFQKVVEEYLKLPQKEPGSPQGPFPKYEELFNGMEGLDYLAQKQEQDLERMGQALERFRKENKGNKLSASEQLDQAVEKVLRENKPLADEVRKHLQQEKEKQLRRKRLSALEWDDCEGMTEEELLSYLTDMEKYDEEDDDEF